MLSISCYPGRAWLIIAAVIYLYEGFTLVLLVSTLSKGMAQLQHQAGNNRDQAYELELSSLDQTDSIDSSKRKLKNILKIFRTKSEVVRLVSEYKFLGLSCSLAVIGLIITIRMVG